jgi:hypothetical protein
MRAAVITSSVLAFQPEGADQMARVFLALIVVLSLSPFEARSAALDSEAECRSISQADLSGCSCQGRYFESKLGPDEGAAALHLVGRSYVSEPGITLASLYERFGAATLNKVAQSVLETRGEVAVYCPFSTNLDD